MTTGIYFLLSANRVVYVGKSTCIESRVRSHIASHRNSGFDSWAWIPCPAKDLDRVERTYLNYFLPEMNRDATTLALRFTRERHAKATRRH